MYASGSVHRQIKVDTMHIGIKARQKLTLGTNCEVSTIEHFIHVGHDININADSEQSSLNQRTQRKQKNVSKN